MTDRQISLPASIVAIGAFDGVHLGHQRLIRSMVEDARTQRVPAVIWTFDPPPKIFFGRASQLSPPTQNLARLASLRADYIVVASFCQTYANRPADAFLADLSQIAPRRVHVGADFRFGKDQKGDVALLSRYFPTSIAATVTCADGTVISSSRIRALRASGHEGEAAALLAAPDPLALLAGSLHSYDTRFREDLNV
ncbi:FAD synthetase family protein [Rhizobium lusitanum]|uniref:FAD synthetase family protein n=1 Tax=Rhizobium lusitanum TaxID=293958 RepID=UPI001AEF5D2D|nr:FAD synthetase family protein [Rhizobium lusitanum]